jgi:hypothetical protein
MKYSVKKNEKYNSVEIKFDAKPAEDVRNVLKANHFRWNHKAQLWYGYMTEEDAKKMLGNDVAEDTTPSKAKPKQILIPEEDDSVTYFVAKSDGTYEERTGHLDAASNCVLEKRGKDWVATDYESGAGVCKAPSKAELAKKLSEMAARLTAFRKTEQYAALCAKRNESKAA